MSFWDFLNPNKPLQMMSDAVSGGNKEEDPYAGMPAYPSFGEGDDNLHNDAYKKFKTQAERSGPSAWSALQNSRINQQEKFGRDNVANLAAGQAAGARSQLAMRGGLSSGASERIGMDATRNSLDMNQKVGQAASDNRAQVGINDEQNRIQQMGMLTGMEQQQNQQALDKYKTQGEIWGAGKQADATVKARPKK